MADPELEAVANLFRLLADIDYRGASALYERLARDTADDTELLELLLPAAPGDRLPHLLFAAVQYLLLGDGSDPIAVFGSEPYAAFRSWCLDRRSELERLVRTHVVQTNEVGRCSALLPCLATVAERARRPLALVEVGTSAGLNLLFDRYRYVFGPGLETGRGDSEVVLRPRLHGDRVPPLSVPTFRGAGDSIANRSTSPTTTPHDGCERASGPSSSGGSSSSIGLSRLRGATRRRWSPATSSTHYRRWYGARRRRPPSVSSTRPSSDTCRTTPASRSC